MKRQISPSVEDMVTALKSCMVETPKEEYPCKDCYLYRFSKDGRMSTGRNCFKHLALDVSSKLTELNDFMGSQSAKLLAENSRLKARAEALENDIINANMNLEIMTDRAEALEKALDKHCSSCYKFRTGTRYCEKYNPHRDGCDGWQFDEAHYTTEGVSKID